MEENADINPFVSEEEFAKELKERENAKERGETIVKALIDTFDTPSGAIVLEWFGRDVCGFGLSCFSNDALTMARKAGRQEAFLMLKETFERARKGQ